MTHEKATEQDMGVSLLPCPFCGGEVHMSDLDDEDDRRMWVRYIECETCDLKMRDWTGWPHEAFDRTALSETVGASLTKAWNRRKPAPEWQGMESAPVSSLWQNKIDDMSRAHGILVSQHRELRLHVQKIEANLQIAVETLKNYADPAGYADEYGNIPDPDEGSLARLILAKILPSTPKDTAK